MKEGKLLPPSGTLINIRSVLNLEIEERLQVFPLVGWECLGFVIVKRDLSKDPKYNCTPYTDPRSVKKLPNYNSAVGFWEVEVE